MYIYIYTYIIYIIYIYIYICIYIYIYQSANKCDLREQTLKLVGHCQKYMGQQSCFNNIFFIVCL